MTRIRWFADRDGYTTAAEGLREAIAQHDQPMVTASVAAGYCTACARTSVFTIGGGPTTGTSLNLRESMSCRRCGLTTRQRLIHLALAEEVGHRDGAWRGALLERTTRLYRVAHACWPQLIGSEFLGADRVSGRNYWWSPHWRQWRRMRHESITSFSYATQSLDLVVHSDVLEHVYDTDAALRECARVLREGGAMLFTVPFAIGNAASILRGRLLPDGGIEHIEPPEYHGDGVRHGGIYTFHTFGWDLLERLREAGFAKVEIGFCHAPGEGFTASNPNGEYAWLGVPNVFRAIR